MKYAITGHKSGLGKYLFDTLSNEHDVVGFTRSNGYDINDPLMREQIIADVKDCDVFINCAPSGFSQVDMLYELFAEWKDEKKCIISIGSNAKDFVSLSVYEKDAVYPYAVHKQSLLEATKQCSRMRECKVSCLSLGYIGDKDDRPRIPYSTVTEYLEILVTAYQNGVRVVEMTIIPDQ